MVIKTEGKRFEALDAFRGLCALSVVLYHMHIVNSFTETAFSRGSYVFVDFFFILSGFVLAHGYAYKEKIEFGKFMKARFFRLYPLHIFMLLVFIVIEFCKLLAFKYAGLSFTNAPFTNHASLEELIPNILLIQSWTPFYDHLSFNYPSWSISIEFYLYAIMYFTIGFFHSKKLVVWSLLTGLAYLSIFTSYDMLTDQVLRGISSFFAGTLIYALYRRYGNLNIPFTVATIIEAVLLGLVIFCVTQSAEFKSPYVPIVFVATVYFFAHDAGGISRILKMNALQSLGRLSYSIYMTHAAILFCFLSIGIIFQKILKNNIAPMINDTRYLDLGSDFNNNIFILVVIFIVLLISNLTYHKIEMPGLALKNR